jgi:type IV secretion system protein VirD4
VAIFKGAADSSGDIDFIRQRELFSFNRDISNWRIFTCIYITIAVLCFFGVNWVAKMLMTAGKHIMKGSFDIDLPAFQEAFIPEQRFSVLYIILLILLAIGYAKTAYDIRSSHMDLNVGQKGTSRWTSREEIKAQYKKIPDKGERGTKQSPGRGYYAGGGGVPIAREGDRLYIDDSPTNNLIIGMTRSGKGEIIIFPMIDIYSRAEKQASLVITDPKLELYSGSAKTLTERGYDVHLLNFIDPEFSMGYNPLTEIIRYYKQNDIPTAQLLTAAFCYSIYNKEDGSGHSGSGEDKYFKDTSTAVLSALILAMIDDCLKADRELEMRRQAAIREFEYEYLGGSIANPAWYPAHLAKEEQHIYESYINMASIANMFTSLQARKVKGKKDVTQLDEYFNRRPDHDIAKHLFYSASIAGDRQRGNVYSSMVSALNVFMYENIARMTMESTFDLRDIGFGKKPTAIFIGQPDYDDSNAFVTGVFIKQLYFTLAKMATHAPGGKSYREVIFLLDEFGNIPPIEGMSNLITVCLGRNIRFNLVLQSYEQLYDKYGEAVMSTIKGNCGNHIYIQNEDQKTANDFSEALGTRGVHTLNRTGRRLAMKKEFTEMIEEQPLMTPDQLKRLTRGEIIVNRVMKREDLSNQDVRPYPIRNVGKYRMLYRYQYLSEYMDPGELPYSTSATCDIWERIRQMQIEEVAAGERPPNDVYPEDPDVLGIEVESTAHVDIKSHMWSADEYLRKDKYMGEIPLLTLGEHVLRNILEVDFQWTRGQDVYEKFMGGTDEQGYQIADLLSSANTLMDVAQERGYAAVDKIMRVFDGYGLPKDEAAEKEGRLPAAAGYAKAERGTDDLMNITRMYRSRQNLMDDIEDGYFDFESYAPRIESAEARRQARLIYARLGMSSEDTGKLGDTDSALASSELEKIYAARMKSKKQYSKELIDEPE